MALAMRRRWSEFRFFFIRYSRSLRRAFWFCNLRSILLPLLYANIRNKKFYCSYFGWRALKNKAKRILLFCSSYFVSCRAQLRRKKPRYWSAALLAEVFFSILYFFLSFFFSSSSTLPLWYFLPCWLRCARKYPRREEILFAKTKTPSVR